MDLKRFYGYQCLMKEKINHHINADSLLLLGSFHDPVCEEYSFREQSSFLKINQMLAWEFLDREFDVGTLTSGRIKREGSKLKHLRVKRHLREKMRSIMRSDRNRRMKENEK